ncbi:MAG: CsiV family protein [Gammaproteobacteria bacterium]
MNAIHYFLIAPLCRLTVISSLLFSPLALADEYQIELLIFEHLASATSDETWEDALIDIPVSGTRNVQWVNYNERQLNAENARLKSSRNYRPLLHTAWIEDVPKKASARAVRLPGNVELSSEGKKLRGTAKVYVGRYLHLDLDLYLPAGETATINGINLSSTPNRYHLKESRRMRSKKVHYFDHPHIGVIAVITPL